MDTEFNQQDCRELEKMETPSIDQSKAADVKIGETIRYFYLLNQGISNLISEKNHAEARIESFKHETLSQEKALINAREGISHAHQVMAEQQQSLMQDYKSQKELSLLKRSYFQAKDHMKQETAAHKKELAAVKHQYEKKLEEQHAKLKHQFVEQEREMDANMAAIGAEHTAQLGQLKKEQQSETSALQNENAELKAHVANLTDELAEKTVRLDKSLERIKKLGERERAIQDTYNEKMALMKKQCEERLAMHKRRVTDLERRLTIGAASQTKMVKPRRPPCNDPY